MKRSILGSFFIASSVATTVQAQVDSVVQVVSKDYTTGNVTPAAPIGAFGYVPADATTSSPEKMYVIGFNSTGQDIRLVQNFGAGETPTFTRLVTNTPLLMFTKDGDLTRGGGTPTPGSLLLNTLPIGSIGAYGAAFIADGAAQVTAGTTLYPELSRKIYRYNLAQDTNGDARDEMTSLVTIKQMQDAIGSTNASTNVSRQIALSSDNSTLYFVDVSTVYGGLWTVPTLGGTVQRLTADANIAAEPAVLNVNGSDRVYFSSAANTANAGRLEYYDTADGQRKTAFTIQALADFLETTTTDLAIASIASDSQGNLYFNNTDSSPERRGVFQLSPDGKLIKIASAAERKAIEAPTGSINSNTLRMQPRTATYTNGTNTFDLTQVLYTVSSPLNAVNGLWVFKPGDFNRDNSVTSADLSAFGSKLTIRGVPSVLDDSRYDLNGNNVIDWKDVKILQTFLDFADGDTDFSFNVDFDDLLSLAQNYGATEGKTWIQGDFTGDDAVNFDDLLLLAQNYQGSGGISGLDSSFASDWALARSLAPEPTSLLSIAALSSLGFRRRR